MHDKRLQLPDLCMPINAWQTLPVLDEVGAGGVAHQQLAVMAKVHVSALDHRDTAATIRWL